MVAKWRLFLQKLWLSVPVITGGAFIYFTSTVLAQVKPDQTLGKESSVVTPVNSKVDRIDGGAVRGSNLFHSFKDFNVGEGRRVDVANPTGVNNIFGRITGTNRSDILGTLGVLGSANLFLLNPNGIIFGPNAQLDIRGSFVASTASSFSFGNGLEYSATNPQSPPLLKVNFTPGLQLGRKLPGEVVNEGNLIVGKDLTLWGGSVTSNGQLAVPEGQLTVEGVTGDVRVKDAIAQTAKLSARGNLILEESQLFTTGDLSLLAQDTVRVRDNFTNPFLAQAGGKLLVQGNQGVDIFALNHPDSGFASGRDMVLRSANTVGGDAHYWSGGSFRIEKLDGSFGDLYSPYDPIIRSTGNVSFNSYIGSSLHILAGGSVNISDFVVITGKETGQDETDFISEEVTLSDGEKISVDGKAQPTLDIRAGVKPDVITGFSEITGRNSRDFFNIDISNPLSNFFKDFSFTNSSNINSSNRADIKVGTIIFANIDLVKLFSKSFSSNISEIISPNELLQGQVLLTNKYQSNTQLQGNIEVSSTLSSLFPNLQNLPNLAIQIGDIKNGGSVFIDSRGDITLTNGTINVSAIPSIGNLNSDNLNFAGNGGNVKFLADNNINLESGSLIVSIGKLGGELILNSGNELLVKDSGVASLTTMTTGEGKGEPLIVKAKNLIEITGGNSLDINNLQQLVDFFNSPLLKNSLDIIDSSGFGPGLGSGFATTTLGSAGAGDLIIDRTAELIITKKNSSSAYRRVGLATASIPNSTGKSGKLTVNADKIKITGKKIGKEDIPLPNDELADEIRKTRTGITSSTQGSGNSGDIEIFTRDLSIKNAAAIASGTFTTDEGVGDGGTLKINADKSIELIGKAILAGTTRGSGHAGELIVNTGKLVLNEGAVLASDTTGSGHAGDLNITTNQISIKNGSRLGAATVDKGNGATINIESNLIELDGTATHKNGTKIRSGIFVNSQGLGKAGNINLDTEKLIVRNGAKISAETDSDTGGNIDLKVQDVLLMRNQSNISTTAGTEEEPGDGGNITIYDGFIVTVPNENSDITANAFEGSGGKIDITSEKIFWMEPRNRKELIDLSGSSSPLNPNFLSTNDITAFSQQNPDLDGLISINLLSTVDPSRGLALLPTSFVDPSELIDQTCTLNSSKSSSQFVNTGRGGLPQNPGNPLNPNTTARRLAKPIPNSSAPLARRTQTSSSQSTIPLPDNQEAESIVEAQSWVRLGNGKIRLVAQTPSVTPQGNWQTTAGCSR